MIHRSLKAGFVAGLLALAGLLLLAPQASADVVGFGDAANYALSDGSFISLNPTGSGDVLVPLVVASNGQFDWSNPAAISGSVFEITSVVSTTPAPAPTSGFTIGSSDPSLNLNPDGSFIVGDTGKFVINGAANLLLTGGLSSPELFAIVNNGGGITMSGGDVVTGTILALTRNVTDGDATSGDSSVTGVVIGGFTTTSNPFIQDLSQFNLQYQSFAPSDAMAPEPATLLLFGAGLIVLIRAMRKRRVS